MLKDQLSHHSFHMHDDMCLSSISVVLLVSREGI